MRILILEDNLERIEFFKRIYKNNTLYITDDIREAYHIVENAELDIMFLDHDLTLDNFKAIGENNTGYDFVKALVEGRLQKQALIYIHSCNPIGGQIMQNLLQKNKYNALWIPFYLLKQQER